MSNEGPSEKIDDVLDILASPLSRYILSVLAGIDPGMYTGTIDVPTDADSEE